MNQISAQKFTSKCGKIHTFVENDVGRGVFHDYLMELKGVNVDAMVAAQKQEEELTQAQKNEEFVEPIPC